MKKIVILISGRKQAGKDTTANFLLTKIPNSKKYSFADPLKEFCINVLGLTHEQCYGTDQQKNSKTKLLWGDMPDVVTSKTKYFLLKLLGEKRYYHKHGYMSGRDILQYFGSNICRKMYSDCWVEGIRNKIKKDFFEGVDCAIIADVRFFNELLGFYDFNYYSIRLKRNENIIPEHYSESELDNASFDLVVPNQNMSVSAQNRFIFEKISETPIFRDFFQQNSI